MTNAPAAQERLIGDAASNQAARNPENTIFEVKRLIGRKFNDPIVQEELKHFPYKARDGAEYPVTHAPTSAEWSMHSMQSRLVR